MENASKALIIGGVILVTLMVIALGVFIFVRASGTVKEQAKQYTVEEIELFNKQFTSYERGSRIYGSEVKGLLQKVQASNAKYSDDRQVEVKYYKNDVEVPEETISNTSLYKVELEYSNKGLVKTINILL